MIKIDYQTLAEESVKNIALSGHKPTILMHVCCGPCTTSPILFLSKYFKVTLIFNNSNIYPKAEHDRRLLELERFLNQAESLIGEKIDVLKVTYDNEEYTKKYLSSYKNEPEGGARCRQCFRARMDQAYALASAQNFDYFVTVMTISRQKNSQILNKIGEELSKKYPNTKYFFSDFKKHGGQEKRNEMVKEFNLYAQDYCGCIYSLTARDERQKKQKASN